MMGNEKTARRTDKIYFLNFFVFMHIANVIKIQVNVRILANEEIFEF